MMTTQARQPDQQTQARLAALLATGAAASVLVPQAVGLLAPFGLTAVAVKAALRLPRVMVAANVIGLGPAGRQVAASEPLYRAAYLVNAALRIQQRIDGGASEADAMRAELPLLKAHLAAQTNRARSAAQVDQVARRHGLLLGWKARMDARTSAECAAANGHNFDVTAMPVIGWPGAVHLRCRCRPVKAFTNAVVLPSISTSTATLERKAATG